jgi:O-antigen/teichoic acid export membrane protein
MFKKIFSTFTLRFISAVINLLIAVVVSQYLGASGKGEQGIMLTTIALIILFDNLVGGASVIYLTPRLKIKNILLASYIWSIFITLSSYFILYFTELVEAKYQLPVAILSGMCSIASINNSVLIGKEKINQSNMLNFLIPLFTFLLLVIFFVSGWMLSIKAYLVALFVTYVVNIIAGFYFLSPHLKNQPKHTLKEIPSTLGTMLKYGCQNQMAHVFQLLSFRISFFVLEYYWSKSQVGIYSNGVSIIESVWMISSSITLLQYSRIVNSTDKKYALQLTELLTKYGMLVAFVALIPIVLLPSAVYTTIFGPDFSELNRLIWVLAPGIWVFNYTLILGHYFSGTGRYYINAIASGVGFIVTIVAVFILVPKFGIYGAAISATISYFCSSLVVIYFFIKSGGKFVLFPNKQELISFYARAKEAVNHKIKTKRS